MRSPLSLLTSLYPPPTFSFEPDFLEDDPVWTPDAREEKSHIAQRARTVLDRAFFGGEEGEVGATCE